MLKLDLRYSLKDGSTISLVIREYWVHVSGVNIITTRLGGSEVRFSLPCQTARTIAFLVCRYRSTNRVLQPTCCEPWPGLFRRMPRASILSLLSDKTSLDAPRFVNPHDVFKYNGNDKIEFSYTKPWTAFFL